MKKFIVALVSVLLLSGFTAPAAHADPNPTFAGTVYHVPNMGLNTTIRISRDRCCGGTPTGPYMNLLPNQHSRSYWPDTDSIYVPAGQDLILAYKASYGWQQNGRYSATGWYNVSSDLAVWAVRD